jgi:hypothetical protein
MEDNPMDNVTRIFPNNASRLAHWIEENFKEIDQFVATFTMKDGTTMTVYDVYSYVEALGNGRNSADIHEFCGAEAREPVGKDYMEILTLEGIMKASAGDYIIKGVSGEFYPCKPDIFEKTYELVD